MIAAPLDIWMGVAGPDRLQAWCGGIELYVSPRRACAEPERSLISEIVKASSPRSLPAAALDEGLLGSCWRSSKRAVAAWAGVARVKKVELLALC